VIRNVFLQRLTAMVMLVVTLVTGLFVPGLPPRRPSTRFGLSAPCPTRYR
jgi:hypothetical protein